MDVAVANRVRPIRYPDESSLVGSRVAFTALLEQMVAKNRGALASLVTRERTAPKLVALLPQPEVLDECVAVDPLDPLDID